VDESDGVSAAGAAAGRAHPARRPSIGPSFGAVSSCRALCRRHHRHPPNSRPANGPTSIASVRNARRPDGRDPPPLEYRVVSILTVPNHQLWPIGANAAAEARLSCCCRTTACAFGRGAWARWERPTSGRADGGVQCGGRRAAHQPSPLFSVLEQPSQRSSFIALTCCRPVAGSRPN